MDKAQTKLNLAKLTGFPFAICRLHKTQHSLHTLKKVLQLDLFYQILSFWYRLCFVCEPRPKACTGHWGSCPDYLTTLTFQTTHQPFIGDVFLCGSNTSWPWTPSEVPRNNPDSRQRCLVCWITILMSQEPVGLRCHPIQPKRYYFNICAYICPFFWLWLVRCRPYSEGGESCLDSS